MKDISIVIKILVFFVIAIFLSGCAAMMPMHGVGCGMGNHESHESHQKESKKEEEKSSVPADSEKKSIYKCPMGHYESDKPGDCPECGMKLEKNE